MNRSERKEYLCAIENIREFLDAERFNGRCGYTEILVTLMQARKPDGKIVAVTSSDLSLVLAAVENIDGEWRDGPLVRRADDRAKISELSGDNIRLRAALEEIDRASEPGSGLMAWVHDRTQQALKGGA